MSEQQDQIFFRNYSIIIGILAVMIVIFLILARLIGTSHDAHAAARAAQATETTKPVGEVRIAGEVEAEPAPATETAAAAEEPGDVGKRVYSGLCFSCHGTGLPGIPQFGDGAAWGPRVSQGKELLYEHALKGFTGASGIMMPPKGGNSALSDEEVKAAVDYMVANSQ